MAQINILDKQTIDKIAAGEVVDRPSSIVKEMLENAIDAKATAITVEIKEGGISLIRITDNGEGISKDDIRNAFKRHATSKIQTVEDLLSIHSLGFRGEALSSIAAVSQVECISKTPNELIGIRYCIDGGEEKGLEEVGAPAGTTFIIRNLFYNTPARRKFLKTAATEASYISNIVERIALSHPDVSIRFINNSQTKLYTSGNGKLKDIIYSVYGRDICSNVIEIGEAALNMRLEGYIGKPVIARGNRNTMIYFINGRYIKSKIIYNAIEEAYKPYMMQHNYPFCILHFEIDSSLIDVNVHPSKMEIRFENSMDVYNFFYQAVRNAISGRELIPEVTDSEKDKMKQESNGAETKTSEKKAGAPKTEKPPEPFEKNRLEKEQAISVMKESSGVYQANPQNSQGLKNIQNVQNTLNSQSVPTEQNVQNTEKAQDTRNTQDVQNTLDSQSVPTAQNMQKMQNSKPSEKLEANQQEEKQQDEQVVNQQGEQMELFDNHFLSEAERVRHKVIGQLFDTYWLVEYDKNLYIIDQHAAHEKVLYEKTMQQFREKEFTSQQLNPPIILTLTMAEAELLERFMPNFNELGYEIEPFGGKEYAVRAVPDNLYAIGKEELLMSLIDNLSEHSQELKTELITEKIASMSCKAAVKGNNSMSYAEANALIEQLLKLENPYHCPHGRPTIISMSKYEIEKKFKRIL